MLYSNFIAVAFHVQSDKKLRAHKGKAETTTNIHALASVNQQESKNTDPTKTGEEIIKQLT